MKREKFPLSLIHGSQQKITEQDKEDHFAGMIYSRGGVTTKEIPDYVVKNTKSPKFKPALNSILFDSEGNILVHVYRKNRDEMYKYFDSFDSKGNFMANVQHLILKKYLKFIQRISAQRELD